MSKVGPWMDQEEREGWAQANGRETGPASSAPEAPKKLSPTKLALALLDAAGKGATDKILALLDLGAEVNCRARASPGATPYRVAIERGHEQAALVLLRAGAMPQPEHCWNMDGEESRNFTQAARAKSFPPDTHKALSTLALKLFVNHGESWKALVQARDLLPAAGPGDDAELMRACFAEQRMDLALEGFRGGAPVDQACWSKSCEKSGWKFGLSMRPEQRRTPLLDLLAEPRAIASMDEKACEELFRGAMVDDDARATRALLDAGLRPSPDWTMEEVLSNAWRVSSDLRPGRQGYLALAAMREKPDMWELAKRCPPAVSAARRVPEAPASLRMLTTLRLQEYADLAPIDARGPEGRSLTHYWALSSTSGPRDGWATLARKHPELFESKDDSGKTGYGLQASKLDDAAKDAFLASLSRIEKREVTREVSRPSPDQSHAAPKARPRL